jgi:hypothetical protein
MQTSRQTHSILRSLLALAASTLAVLIVAEVILRLPAMQAALPPVQNFHSPVVDHQLTQLEALEAQTDVDVLFIGSSEVFRDVAPATFDKRVEELTGHDLTSYNMGMESFSMVTTSIFMRDVFGRYTSPEVLVIGLAPRDLNANSRNRIETDPKLLSTTGIRAYRGDMPWHLAQRWALRNWYLYRYSTSLQILARDWLGGEPHDEIKWWYITPQGWQQNIEQRLSDDVDGILDRTIYPDLVNDFYIGGEPLQQFEELLRYCKAKEMRCVLVNTPQSRYAFDFFPNGRADYDSYVETVRSIAAIYGLEFLDMQPLADAGQLDDEDFENVNHLNRWGAIRFSRVLAERMVETGVFGEAVVAGE